MVLGQKGDILLSGDLNARTGNLDDSIIPDKYDEEFLICINENPPKRNSQDSVVNPRGNDLLDMCKSLDLNIINGRKVGNIFGNYTCFKWNGNSVVDYLLASDSLFHKIPLQRVVQFIPWISAHCPLHFTLEIHTPKNKVQHKELHKEAPKRFMWSSASKQRYLNMLNSTDFIHKLDLTA